MKVRFSDQSDEVGFKDLPDNCLFVFCSEPDEVYVRLGREALSLADSDSFVVIEETKCQRVEIKEIVVRKVQAAS